MLRFAYYIPLFFICLQLYSQDVQDYSPLKSKGIIPKDFLSDYVNSDKRDFQGLKRQEKFYRQNVYFLQSLLSSGKVLFGDTVTQYINYLADVILQNDPDTRKELRFYAARIPYSNAYCAENGIVLVNIGLLAKVENEAQLAFIICHEISHYKANHRLQLYNDDRKDIRKLRPEELLLSQNLYSQQLELEADSMGFALYLGTPFEPQAALGAFAITEVPELIFPKLHINQEWTNKLPSDKLAIIANLSEKSSHPSSLERQENIKRFLIKKSAKQNVFLNRQRFDYIQKLCRFDMCGYQVERQMYEYAIENAMALNQYYKIESKYLNKVITYSWYGLCKFINAARFWEIHQDYQNVEGGDFATLCAYTELMPRLDFVINVIEYVKSQRKILDSNWLINIQKDLYKEIGKYYVSDITPEGNITFSNEPGNRDIIQIPDTDFIPIITAAYFEKKNAQLPPKKKNTHNSNTQRERLFKGFNLGIDTIVFVEPSYQRFDLRHGKEEELEVSTAMQIGMIQKIKEYAAAQNLHAYLLHSSELQASRCDYFNRLTLLTDWMTEKSGLKDLGMLTFRHEELQSLVERYNTPYFAWIGGRHILHKRNFKPSFLLDNMFSFPFTNVSEETFFYLFVYNLQTEQYLVLYPRYVRMNDRPEVFHSIIYDMIFQIIQREKKKK